MINILEKLNNELRSVNNRIESIRLELGNLPPGRLLHQQNGKYHKWYITSGSTRTHISSKDSHLLSLLFQKEYLTSQLEELLFSQKVLSMAIKKYNNHKNPIDDFMNDKGYYEILSDIILENSSKSNWRNEEYEHNTSFPEDLKFKSISGNILRSKSEIIIDQSLYFHNLEYRYECKLCLGETFLYPDFTIRHPSYGKTLYWEHFGKMDDPEYVNRSIKKINLYVSNQIIPGENLIITYESKNNPFDSIKAEQKINEYLL